MMFVEHLYVLEKFKVLLFPFPLRLARLVAIDGTECVI